MSVRFAFIGISPARVKAEARTKSVEKKKSSILTDPLVTLQPYQILEQARGVPERMTGFHCGLLVGDTMAPIARQRDNTIRPPLRRSSAMQL